MTRKIKRRTIKDLSQKRLKEVLFYCPKTGKWTWVISPANCVKTGDRAWCVDSNGYRYISIEGKAYKSSRLAFLFMEGYFPENTADHLNRIRDDDRWDNLREATQQCQNRNQKMQKNNTSGIVGLSWDDFRKRWKVYIRIANRLINLGSYYKKDKTKAVLARWIAEKKYNFPNCQSDSTAYRYLKNKGII